MGTYLGFRPFFFTSGHIVTQRHKLGGLGRLSVRRFSGGAVEMVLEKDKLDF